MNRLYPIFLKLENAPCLIVGAGAIASRKAEALLECGATLTIVAPKPNSAILDLEKKNAVQLEIRDFRESDLDGMQLVIAATDDATVNESVWRACEKRRILCNVVDDPERCNFYAGSTITRGDLKIAISTNGKSPAISARIRRTLEQQFGEEYARAIAAFGQVREEIRKLHPEDPERRMDILRTMADSDDLFQALDTHNEMKLEAILDSWTSCLSD